MPVRELAHWIRENLMLTLSDAVFDCSDAELVPVAGACITCLKRTGANTALFDDISDDRCMDAPCFLSKVDAHIAIQKERTKGLVQITRAYHTNGEDKILTRHDYTIIEPATSHADPGDDTTPPPCSKATTAIVVEGPGKRGELVRVCADPECEVRGKPNYRAEREASKRERERAWKREEAERENNRDHNRSLLDAVLERVPKTLTRADYEIVVSTIINRLEYDDWDAVCECYKINTDETREPDAAALELRKRAEEATEPQLSRMLIELALLRSGFSDEPLPPHDPLVSTAARYGVSLDKPKKQTRPRGAKCAPKAATKKAKPKAIAKGKAATNKATKKGGAA